MVWNLYLKDAGTRPVLRDWIARRSECFGCKDLPSGKKVVRANIIQWACENRGRVVMLSQDPPQVGMDGVTASANGRLSFVMEVGLSESSGRLALDAHAWLETPSSPVMLVVTISINRKSPEIISRRWELARRECSNATILREPSARVRKGTAIGGALTGMMDWHDPAVIKEMRLLLEGPLEEAWGFLEDAKVELIEEAVRRYENFRAAERNVYGENSAYREALSSPS